MHRPGLRGDPEWLLHREGLGPVALLDLGGHIKGSRIWGLFCRACPLCACPGPAPPQAV